MKKILGLMALSLAFSEVLAGSALAETHLRVGLAEDPDVLDPSLARTYVGRIVFSSICDKLFDIDEKLAVVPQLALSHETSPDGKTVTIKLRPGVKFHDGEPLDAAAAKYSLDRHLTMKGSFRKPELGSVDKVEVVDPLTIKLILKEPFSPLLAQLTDRAGMMVSPKAAEAAGDKFGLKPVCAGPFKFVERVQQDRIVVEKFTDYWNKDNVFIDKITYLPIVDGTVRLANLRSGGLDLIERVLATDIKAVRDNPKLKLIKAVSLGYTGRAGQPMDQPAEFLLSAGLPDSQARPRQGQGAVEGGGCHRPAHARFHGAQRSREPRRRRGRAVDGRRGGLRSEDSRHRVRDLAEAGRGRRLPALSHRLERAQ